MQFRIAGRDFAVVITSRPIVRGGITRSAYFEPSLGKILISDEMPKENRRRALFHELRHAWTTEYGRPTDDEGDATSVGTFLDLMLEQFDSQGGDAALVAMQPVGTDLPATAFSARSTGGTVSCGCCSGIIAAGSIIDSEPIWRETYGCFSLNRGCQCEACGNVTTWTEKCTAIGEPLGEIIAHPKPTVLRGAKAAAWLAKNAVVA